MVPRWRARAQGGFVAVAIGLLAALAFTRLHADTPSETADLNSIREAVTRYVIGVFEPPCSNYWDHTTYCLELEGGEQPTPELLKRLRDVAPGLHSVAYCTDTLGMSGQTTDPFIRIRSIALRSRDEAIIDVVAFCGHGTPTAKRVAGAWQYSDSVGGWAGCGPVPADCAGRSTRSRKKAP